jgi:hypothetical protein
MHISGDNFQRGIVRGDGTYYFSRYSHVWGWATWRRAWLHYDVTMKALPSFVNAGGLRTIFPTHREQQYWLRCFRAATEGRIDTWDYQWAFAVWSQNGLSVLPNTNLVTNIGFGSTATHTSGIRKDVANLQASHMDRIIHPTFVLPHNEADAFTFRDHFNRSVNWRLRQRIAKVFQ